MTGQNSADLKERCGAHGRVPDFLIIGAMKAATTTLHVQLAAQDGIFMSTPKELDYFNAPEQYPGGLAGYLYKFRDAPETAICGESSTSYTKLPTFPETAARIKTMLPHVRLIYVMRHPLERLVSHFVHDITCQLIPRKATVAWALENAPELVSYGRYAMQLEPYIEAFGRERILPVFSERLRVEPEAELTRICRFLGHRGHVAWEAGLDQQNVSRERLMSGPLTRLIVRNEPLRRFRQAVVPAFVRNAIRRRFASNIAKPELDKSLRDELIRVFDQDLRTLGAWLGHSDLCCANFNRITAGGPLVWTA